MTQDEQQQVNAMRNAYVATITNMAHQDADKAAAIESLAQRLKAAEAERDALKAKAEKKAKA